MSRFQWCCREAVRLVLIALPIFILAKVVWR